MDISITVALIAAVVTAAGWLVTHILQRQRDVKKKAQEARAEYVQRQIEELYGPMFNLATQIVITNHVLHGILQSAPPNPEKVEEVFYFDYFQPLHQEARELLKSKLHLVQGSRVPATIYAYLMASVQEDVQRKLWREHQISTSTVQGRAYPDSFTFEVQETLEGLLASYDALLNGLHNPPNLSVKRDGAKARRPLP